MVKAFECAEMVLLETQSLLDFTISGTVLTFEDENVSRKLGSGRKQTHHEVLILAIG